MFDVTKGDRMTVRALSRRHPVATLTTTLFVVAFATTVAYFAGLVPGVPRTLPTFTTLVAVTVLLLAATLLAWVLSPRGS